MIKVAIAGFGKIGRIRYEILSNDNDFQVIGIFEKNINVLIPEQIKRYDNIDELILSGPDAIFICAFNDVLASYTIKAIKYGIHVFCEKPPARSVEELKDVEKALSRSKSILKYGFNHRYHYSIMEAKKMIKEGEFGKLLLIRGVYGKAGSIDYDKNWRNYKKLSGGGILIDQGIHMLDLLRHLTETEFTVVHAMTRTLFWNIESEDNAFIILENDNGTIANIHSSATQWRHKFLLELIFENGYITLDGILSGTRSYAPECLRYGLREFEDVTMAMGKPQEHVIWFENDDSWKLEIKEFKEAIHGFTKIVNGNIKDAMDTLSLVETVYKQSI
jgi:predicted dehydrogenase